MKIIGYSLMPVAGALMHYEGLSATDWPFWAIGFFLILGGSLTGAKA